MKIHFFALIVGLLLPWQTRFLLHVPTPNGVVWDFGILSIFISQIVIAIWIVTRFYPERRAVLSSLVRRVRTWQGGVVVGIITLQLIFSQDRLLTVQWLVSVALLAGVGIILYRSHEERIPFINGVLASVILQSLLAAMQVFTGVTFGSALLGIAEHRVSVSGTSVLEYAGNRYLRAYGGQPHPNIFGGLLVVGMMAFSWMLAHKRTLGVKNNIRQYVIVACGALFFSFSRSAWIGFVAWVIYVVTQRHLLRESQRIMIRWATITFGVLLIIFSPLVLSRATPSSPIEQRSISERVSELTTWKSVMREHGVFGTGLGAYTATLSTPGSRVPVHSVLLLALAELGIVGILGVVAIAINYARRFTIPAFLIAIIPLLVFDHYMWSLWSGQVIMFLALFQLFKIGNDDEADDNQK